MKKAFSLLEVIVVITVVLMLLFFLSSKYVNVTSYSSFSSAKATYSMIKSAVLASKTKAVLKGGTFLLRLDEGAINSEGEELFSKVLKAPIISSKTGWMKTSGNEYMLNIDEQKVYFEYKNGLFYCKDTNKICKELE